MTLQSHKSGSGQKSTPSFPRKESDHDGRKQRRGENPPIAVWAMGCAQSCHAGNRRRLGQSNRWRLHRQRFKAVAAIAQLAHAAGHEVGADPDIFIWTVPDEDDAAIYPYGVPHDCAPTAEEMAAHLAMTLFAVQQQSHREQSMQTDSNMSLGRAVGMIAYGNFNEKGFAQPLTRCKRPMGGRKCPIMLGV